MNNDDLERKLDELMPRVREALNRPSVLAVKDHFAGYFNELGITVELESNTPDAEVALLKDRVAPVMKAAQLPFEWMVSFRRTGKSAGIYFPDGLFTDADE